MVIGRSDDPLIGEVVLERYRILNRLGAGGMGMVYEVEHTVMGTHHALKMMIGPRQVQKASSEGERFLREAQLCARIRHPSLILVTDFGFYDGHPSLVMDLVKGKDFGQILRNEGAHSPAKALQILKAVTGAVATIHQEGVIHRDIKPANIMREDDTGRTVLMDLGIAKDLNDIGSTMEIIGTPAYMSPEQARDSASVSKASDVYSLGATFVALLKGRAPIAGTSVLEVLTRARELLVEHGSIFGMVEDLESSLPPPVAALIRDMTRPEPADRLQDGDAILKRIERIEARQDTVVKDADEEDMTFIGPQFDGGSDQSTAPPSFEPACDETMPPTPMPLAEQPDEGEAKGEQSAAMSAEPVDNVEDIKAEVVELSPEVSQSNPGPEPRERETVPTIEKDDFDKKATLGRFATPGPTRKSGGGFGKILTTMVVVAVLGGAGWYLYENRDSILKKPESTKESTAPVEAPLQPDGAQGVSSQVLVQQDPIHQNPTIKPGASEEARAFDWPRSFEISPGIVVVLVPPGEATLGDDSGKNANETPSRKVSFTKPFMIGRNEVTRSDYATFLTENESSPPPGNQFNLENATYKPVVDPHLPVSHISIQDARAYSNWLSRKSGLTVRLPGEVEWEYAARGPAGNRWPWGGKWHPKHVRADGYDGPVSVGSYPTGKSWVGAYDMAGNLFEWCDNWYDSELWESVDTINPGPDPATSHEMASTVRGGSYANPRDLCRGSFRVGIPSGDRQAAVGFRILVEADQALQSRVELDRKQ